MTFSSISTLPRSLHRTVSRMARDTAYAGVLPRDRGHSQVQARTSFTWCIGSLEYACTMHDLNPEKSKLLSSEGRKGCTPLPAFLFVVFTRSGGNLPTLLRLAAVGSLPVPGVALCDCASSSRKYESDLQLQNTVGHCGTVALWG